MSSSRSLPPEIVEREHRPDALRVELVLEQVRFERREVLGHQDVAELAERHLDQLVDAQDGAAVFRLVGVVLLPVGEARLGIRRKRDTRLGAVHAGLPGALGGHELAVLELLRVLAEVPDVPGRVLRVPVERVLDHPALLGHDVVDDERIDPGDRLLAVGDGDDDTLDVSLAVRLAVDPAAARLHRPVGVVDLVRELRGLERDRLRAGREGAPRDACGRRLVGRAAAPGQGERSTCEDDCDRLHGRHRRDPG